MTAKKHEITTNAADFGYIKTNKDTENYLDLVSKYSSGAIHTGYHGNGFNSGQHYLAMNIGEPTREQVEGLKAALLSGDVLTPAAIRAMGIYSPSRAIAKIRHDEEIPVKTHTYITEKGTDEFGNPIESVRKTEYSISDEEIARFVDERPEQVAGLRAVVAGNRKRRAGRDALNFFYEVTKENPGDAELQEAILTLYPYAKDFANFNIRELTDGVTDDIYVDRSPYIEPSAANDDDYEWQEAE